MKKSTLRKYTNSSLATISCALLLAFLWSYSETGQPPRLKQFQENHPTPNYYIVNTTSHRYNEQGTLDLTVTSKRIEHVPNSNNALMAQPHFFIKNSDTTNWEIRSNKGLIYNDGDRIDLEQQVIVNNQDNSNILKTSALTIYPKQKIVKTDRYATIISPQGQTHTQGLHADLVKQQVTLLSKVRGQYNAAP